MISAASASGIHATMRADRRPWVVLVRSSSSSSALWRSESETLESTSPRLPPDLCCISIAAERYANSEPPVRARSPCSASSRPWPACRSQTVRFSSPANGSLQLSAAYSSAFTSEVPASSAMLSRRSASGMPCFSSRRYRRFRADASARESRVLPIANSRMRASRARPFSTRARGLPHRRASIPAMR